MAELIDPDRSERSDRAAVRADAAELDARDGESRRSDRRRRAFSPVEGIVHRYPDRVLLKLVHVCPVYCRFCFRREMVGPGKRQSLSRAALDAALDYVRAHPEIWEVILTGGDPLILSPRRLREVLRALARSITSRSCACTPACRWWRRTRITPQLVRALKAPGKATYVVLHANHPRELTDARARRLRAHRRRRHPDAEPDRAAERRQRRRGDAGRADARLRREPHQALLPASRRPRAGHRASAHRRSTRARR